MDGVIAYSNSDRVTSFLVTVGVNIRRAGFKFRSDEDESITKQLQLLTL